MASTKFTVGQRIVVTSSYAPKTRQATVVADIDNHLTGSTDVALQYDGVAYNSPHDYHFRPESDCSGAGTPGVTGATGYTGFKIGDRVRATYPGHPSHVGTIIKDYGNRLWGVRYDTYTSYMSPDDSHTASEKNLSPFIDPNVRCNTNVKAAQKQTEEVDISDWRAWQHKAVGDCPCGIARQACSYHR